MELAKQRKVAIQGIKGSFHHQVAIANFGSNIYLDECMTFKELAKNVDYSIALASLSRELNESLESQSNQDSISEG